MFVIEEFSHRSMRSILNDYANTEALRVFRLYLPSDNSDELTYLYW